LAAASAPFIDDFVQHALDHLGVDHVQKVADGPGASARVRVDSTIIVDYPVVTFVWQGIPVETRVGITTWYSKRKSKLWMRANPREPLENNAQVKLFLAEMKTFCRKMQLVCLEFIAGLMATKHNLKMHGRHEIFIQVVSSGSPQVFETIRAEPDYIASDRDSAIVERTLLETFERDFDIKLESIPDEKIFYKRYVYPIIDANLVEERREALESAGAELSSAGCDAAEEVRALARIRSAEKFTDVWGIVYEAVPLGKNSVSGPFVVSSELSLELGGIF
jgi:hypothetical protein